MITLTKSGNAIVFEFDDNSHYLNDGIIEAPVNSLTLVTDDSQMATFRKAASNDIFISATYDELGMSKADLETFYKENMVGSTGGGGGVTSGEVQTMIDESISGKADTSDVQEIASDVSTVSGDVNTLSGSVNTLTGAVNTLSGDVSTLSGSVDSNHNAITALNGDVQTLSGQVQGDETILTGHTANTDIHVTATDKQNWNNKSDFSGSYNDLTDKPTIPVVPTNVSAFNNDAGYATSGYVDSSVSGKVNTTDFNTYSANTDNRLSEDEEVTSAALNELNEALDDKADATAVTASIAAAVSGKQDTLVSGTNIKTINNESILGSGNIDIQGGGGKAIEAGRGISVTTGATADTVSFDLPISADTDGNKALLLVGSGNTVPDDTIYNIVIGSGNTTTGGGGKRIISGSTAIGFGNKVGYAGNNVFNKCYSFALGYSNEINGGHSYAIGYGNKIKAVISHKDKSFLIGYSNDCSFNSDSEGEYIFGEYNKVTNSHEFALGKYNNSVSDGTTSGNTFFSIGNGTANNARHNAFEIRQNGDIYITKDGADVKLQDQLGGGGLPESAFTAYTASTDARLAEDEEVTAAALNTLNDATAANTTALGGLKLVQLTQAQYDALATKDASTLYIITGSN